MASPRLSLRGQLALRAIGASLVSAALAFAAALPLVQSAAARGRADDLVPLLAALLLLAASILSLLLYSLLVRLVARPAERLLDATERIGTPQGEAPLLGGAGPLLGRLGVAFERMGRRLEAEQAKTLRQLHDLQRVNRELAEARDAMVRQEKLATVGRLSAGVAHEIGNPLAALLGYLEVLRNEPAARPLADYLERMEREGRRIDRIVRDLLDFARPPRDAATHPVAIEPLVAQTVRLLSGQKRFQGIEFRVDVARDLPPVRGEAHRLQQVLVNLFVNAADAMEGRGTIDLLAAREDGAVRLEVADRGPGIAPADRARVFDPFFTTKQPGEGTGLGLAISHAILDSFGGTIEATAREGGGARFVLRVPVVEDGTGSARADARGN